jgi:hypothetical protein
MILRSILLRILRSPVTHCPKDRIKPGHFAQNIRSTPASVHRGPKRCGLLLNAASYEMFVEVIAQRCERNTGWKPVLLYSSGVWSDAFKSPAGRSANQQLPRDGVNVA